MIDVDEEEEDMLPEIGSEGGDEVTLLTGETFNSLYEDNNVWLVEFYVPWSNTCRELH